MDAYGVIQLGGYLLSIPGLLFYLFSSVAFVFLLWRLSDGYFRLTKFVILSAATIVFWTLGLVELGLWFYVKA